MHYTNAHCTRVIRQPGSGGLFFFFWSPITGIILITLLNY